MSNIEMSSMEVQVGNSTVVVADDDMEHEQMSTTDKVLKISVGLLMTVAIVCIMTNSGINLQRKQLINVLRRPLGPCIGFFCQFLLLPLVTLGICRAMGLEQDILMSALINSCCPGGVMSNFLTHITKGDVALSVTMSFLSTVCAFFMMPFSLWAFSSFFVGAKVDPPYMHIAISLASLIIPVLGGAALKHFRESWSARFLKLSKGVIVVTLLISGVIFAVMYPSIYFVGKDIILSGFLVALAGFFFGYSLGRIFRLNEAQCRAVCFETGFQNVAISFAVIQFSFPGKSDDMFAFPLWYTTGVAAYSAIFVAGFMIHRRFCSPNVPTVRGHHKKVNSQTVQLMTPIEGDDEEEHVVMDCEIVRENDDMGLFRNPEIALELGGEDLKGNGVLAFSLNSDMKSQTM